MFSASIHRVNLNPELPAPRLWTAHLRLAEEFIKVANQLVQNSQAFLAAFVGFIVELVEVDDRRKQDSGLSVILRVAGGRFQLFYDVTRDDVMQKPISLALENLRRVWDNGWGRETEGNG